VYEGWRGRKEGLAKEAFLGMFRESAFVEFWGRMKKAGLPPSVSSVSEEQPPPPPPAADEDGPAPDDPDLRLMARNTHLSHIRPIFRNDNRWAVWDHLPALRDQWILDYLDQLDPPKQTVYQK